MEGGLDFALVSTVWSFWLLNYFYCKVKQRTKKSTRRKRNCGLLPKTHTRAGPRGTCGWAAGGQAAQAAGNGENHGTHPTGFQHTKGERIAT